ncbi:MAG TPA: response regulator transcription factor [Termitinemataceae bacterium]|jgi:two-component system phosphate regulon response regulator PhoB|nr:response regulator transcription factor [Termitinemataceae bacterium]HOM23670.1 response regulator transcription factor [Termitinemataceae bacterium]HPP99411.1 response regulator transcription factor [Termitinemataceae bacterium]
MIYLVEDNPQIREVVSEYLKIKEYQVREFEGVSGVLESMQQHRPDLCILDVALPDGNGFALAKTIRQQYPGVPFIFLTARESESDRILGFEIGADDYVVKPFSPRELVLRVEAVLRRSQSQKGNQGALTRWYLEDDVLEIDEVSQKVLINGSECLLTSAEWKILSYLSQHPGQLFSREQLLGACLEYYYTGSERTIDTHVKNIRHKLGKEGWIETRRGFGYRFAGKVADSSQ